MRPATPRHAGFNSGMMRSENSIFPCTPLMPALFEPWIWEWPPPSGSRELPTLPITLTDPGPTGMLTPDCRPNQWTGSKPPCSAIMRGRSTLNWSQRPWWYATFQ